MQLEPSYGRRAPQTERNELKTYSTAPDLGGRIFRKYLLFVPVVVLQFFFSRDQYFLKKNMKRGYESPCLRFYVFNFVF